MPKTLLPQLIIWIQAQNVFLFNIALKKTESYLIYRKLQNVAELVTINASFIAVKLGAIFILAFDEDNYIDEILNKVKLPISQFTNLLQREIIQIFAQIFRSINLYKLHHMREYNEIYQNQIFIEESALKMHKITDSYINYSRNNML